MQKFGSPKYAESKVRLNLLILKRPRNRVTVDTMCDDGVTATGTGDTTGDYGGRPPSRDLIGTGERQLPAYARYTHGVIAKMYAHKYVESGVRLKLLMLTRHWSGVTDGVIVTTMCKYGDVTTAGSTWGFRVGWLTGDHIGTRRTTPHVSMKDWVRRCRGDKMLLGKLPNEDSRPTPSELIMQQRAPPTPGTGTNEHTPGPRGGQARR